eukprot:TRINITY_DN3758_c0_g1_i7.p1 TRINITY_DN3758_c0_g1~~TRINITY_DN3758_c0_g1_i7.p1  ORF type:complete len:708 (-),score=120.22 TRINITY_DN3758_c0_g1_i7:103-2226(-)
MVYEKQSKGCVLVRVLGPDYNDKRSKGRPFASTTNGITTLTASGVVVHNDKDDIFILTTASLLTPFFAQSSYTYNTPELVNGTTIDVLCELEAINNGEKIEKITGKFKEDIPFTGRETWIECTLEGLSECSGVRDIVYEIAKDFKLGWGIGWDDESENESVTILEAHDFSNTLKPPSDGEMVGFEWYAVLRVKDRARVSTGLLPALTIGDSRDVMRGDNVMLIGSPYGLFSPLLYSNSFSNGIVSNILYSNDKFGNQQGCLFLTDARCFPGNDGGAAIQENGYLIGLIAPPLRRLDNTLLSFHPILPIHTILPTLYPIIYKNATQTGIPRPLSIPRFGMPSSFSHVKDSLVLIQIGSSWASGIIVSKDGHIITSAHLFTPYVPAFSTGNNEPLLFAIPPYQYNQLPIKIRVNIHPSQTHTNQSSTLSPSNKTTSHQSIPQVYSSQSWYTLPNTQSSYPLDKDNWTWLSAQALYISHTHLDVALLKITPLPNVRLSPMKYSPSTTRNIKHGQTIFVLGHGIFSGDKEFMPTCSKGIISNIINVNGEPASIQTTAVVHHGNSGGILFNSQGDFLGLVTSNAQHKSGAIFHRLNFSIPVNSLLPILDYANGKDEFALEKLRASKNDKFLYALWKLKVGPKEERQQQKEVGSKFMEFIQKMKDKDGVALGDRTNSNDANDKDNANNNNNVNNDLFREKLGRIPQLPLRSKL